MKILITGVAGFIGSNFSNRLLDMGHIVIGMDKFNSGFMRNIDKKMGMENFQFIMGNITNPPILKDVHL